MRRQSGGAWLSKLASGSTCNARFIRGTEQGDARFATAALSDQHADALKKTSGYRVAHSSRCCGALLAFGATTASTRQKASLLDLIDWINCHLIAE